MRGSINNSILYSTDQSIRSIVGTPVSTYYTTVIKNSDIQQLEISGEVHESPAIELHELGSVTTSVQRVPINLRNGPLGLPAFLPNLSELSIDDLGDNPSTPTIAGSIYLNASVGDGDVQSEQLEMLLATGADSTIVSTEVAKALGFDPDLDTPDFVADLRSPFLSAGDVAGFYADQFAIPTADGELALENVPLVVWDVAESGTDNILDGVIGMNLFVNHDLVLNPQPGNSYLGLTLIPEPHSCNLACIAFGFLVLSNRRRNTLDL